MQPRPLKRYLEEVNNKLEEIEALLAATSIQVDWRAPTRLILRGTLVFIDGSTLHFLEYISIQGDRLERIVYRFHYATRDNKLVFRYDNAPHHPELETFPHHKHLASGRVVPSKEKSLVDVLEEIRSLVLQSLSSQPRGQTGSRGA